VDRVEVPRADVEIDVDMENSESGVYLWGVRISRTGEDSWSPYYLPFVSWDALDGDEEAEVFTRFWTWMTDLRDATFAESRSFAAYCYSSAENTQMLRIAAQNSAGPGVDEVAEFVASPYWIDLHAVVKAQIVTGGGLGLKEVAPLAGFQWRDANPGGDQSMVWYDRAVHDSEPAIREEYRDRLLAYNEDDVEATERIRDWLDSATIDSISERMPEPKAD
jgi:predicted RecB family nuclease